jgi:hypothetical protein
MTAVGFYHTRFMGYSLESRPPNLYNFEQAKK